MIITDLPVEMILPIIYKTKYIDVIRLYMVCKRFKNIIDNNSYDIYLSFEKNSCEIYWYPCYQTSDWYEAFNYHIFLKIYIDSIRNKKQSLIILKRIHKLLVRELTCPVVSVSEIPKTMRQAIHCYLMQLCPNKIKNINKESQDILQSTNRTFLKETIEKYVPNDLLNSINITGIKIPGLINYTPFNFTYPKIYLCDKEKKTKTKYLVKINDDDTKLFDIV
jgi:hypothetical protein